jgi:hypothetical protein
MRRITLLCNFSKLMHPWRISCLVRVFHVLTATNGHLAPASSPTRSFLTERNSATKTHDKMAPTTAMSRARWTLQEEAALLVCLDHCLDQHLVVSDNLLLMMQSFRYTRSFKALDRRQVHLHNELCQSSQHSARDLLAMGSHILHFDSAWTRAIEEARATQIENQHTSQEHVTSVDSLRRVSAGGSRVNPHQVRLQRN